MMDVLYGYRIEFCTKSAVILIFTELALFSSVITLYIIESAVEYNFLNYYPRII